MPTKKTASKKATPKASPSSKSDDNQNILERVEEIVEEKMHDVMHNKQTEHVLHDFVGAFRWAQLQDYIMFGAWIIFLVRALIELWAFVWGVILLLLALLLLNMFFGRK